jgi:uncharacterized protein (TIGR03000 family)
MAAFLEPTAFIQETKMWRRRITKGVLGIAGVALLLSPGTARAQVFFTPFGSGLWGSGLWGSNNLGALYARPVFPGMGRGAFPGFNSPYFGEMGGVNPYAYNPLLYNAAFGGMGYGGTGMAYGGFGGMGYGTVLALPGFASSGELARKRPTMSPALAVADVSPIKQAAYDAAGEDRARIEIVVPAGNAEVTLQGVRMTQQSGAVRRYFSPPLDSGSKYRYDVQVRWTDNQGKHTQTRHVRVWAGASRRVDFTAKE